MTKPETPSKELLDEIVRKIVEVSRAKRLILFGSAARGAMENVDEEDTTFWRYVLS
jgi:hypothetical protein